MKFFIEKNSSNLTLPHLVDMTAKWAWVPLNYWISADLSKTETSIREFPIYEVALWSKSWFGAITKLQVITLIAESEMVEMTTLAQENKIKVGFAKFGKIGMPNGKIEYSLLVSPIWTTTQKKVSGNGIYIIA